MKHVTVLPNLVLTSRMHKLVLEKLRSLGVKVDKYTFAWFTDPKNWKLIPNPNNKKMPFFKAELIVLSGPPYLRTIKVNVWFGADIRLFGKPLPHNHPWWPVKAYILDGGYTQDTWDIQGVTLDDFAKAQHIPASQIHAQRGVVLRAGMCNVMPHQLMHEVTEVHEQGQTLTLMDCGPSKKNAWGYLDLEESVYSNCMQHPVDAAHKKRVKQLNAHLF